MFTNRIEAGMMLADRLKKYKGTDAVILAVPRGGVPVAFAVAKELGLPVQLVLAKKIGHPLNKEYAIGAAGLTDYFVVPHDNVPEAYIRQEVAVIRTRLNEMQQQFMGGKEAIGLKGKQLIVIDDGIATGNTLLATISLLRKMNPSKLVIAVPVASASAVEKLSEVADEVVALLVPDEFYGVGAFYEDFSQVTDDEVKRYLDLK